jgi:arylsulfatase A-like enzyme
MEGLTGPEALSKWCPLWGMLGIGLPLTFAGQVRPAMMFLRVGELVPLYATEWLIFGVMGLSATALSASFDALTRRSRWVCGTAAATDIVFGIVAAVSVFLGLLTWISSIRHSALLPKDWKGLILTIAVVATIVVTRGRMRAALRRVAATARFASMAGIASMLSLPLVVGAESSPNVAHRIPTSSLDTPPNIVLITVDALAASHLNSYGYRRNTSPNIAAFASHAVVFDRFYSNANFTTPAVASILTGVLPWTHRAMQLQGRADDNSILQSLPARLHEAGYVTGYFGSNPWAGARRQGFSPFFDHKDADFDWVFGPCFDAAASRFPYLCAAALNPFIDIAYATLAYATSLVGVHGPIPHSDLERIVGRAVRWTEGRSGAPVFMWIHFFPPHDPYAAPEPWLGKFDDSAAARTVSSSRSAPLFDSSLEPLNRIKTLEARYDESLAYMDHYVGELIVAIHSNLGPNTAILLTADHGESFDHGYGAHAGIMLYEDLIHIPMIMELPNNPALVGRRRELSAQIDIAPTIAAIAGIAAPTYWEGHSLILPPPDNDGRTIYSMNFEQNRNRARLSTGSVAALRSDWKLVRFMGQPRYANMGELQTQLFNVADDPYERNNLIAVHPEIAASLSAEIDNQLAEHGTEIGE